MKNQIFTATAKPAGFAMPSCAALITNADAVKVRDAHAGAVRRAGSHSWKRLRSLT